MFQDNETPSCFFCDRELKPSLAHPGFYVRECECDADYEECKRKEEPIGNRYENRYPRNFLMDA